MDRLLYNDGGFGGLRNGRECWHWEEVDNAKEGIFFDPVIGHPS